MENKKPKEIDSKIVVAIVLSFCFILVGILSVINKKDNAFVVFLLGGIPLIYLIYLLRKTKDNKNERYVDERKKFVIVKSKSISFDILFTFMVILGILIRTEKIKMDSYDVIMVVIGSALIIKFISYLACKYKY
jgi:TRAP-type uncharacterized transport system fused permease subunit